MGPALISGAVDRVAVTVVNIALLATFPVALVMLVARSL